MNARTRLLGAAALLLLALQQAVLWWLYYHAGAKDLVGDELQYLASARAVLAGGPWHPSHLWPPGQALLLAALLGLFGDSLLPLQVVQTALLLLCGALLWRLARRLGASRLAAGCAAAVFALDPSTAAYAQYLWPELPHLTLFLLALNLLLPRVAGTGTALVAGLALGGALLFKSLLTGFWPLLLLSFVSLRPLRVRAWPALGFVFGILAITAPALIAGHRMTGHYSIADSSSFNLLEGLSDHSRNDYVDDPVGPKLGEYMDSGSNADERNLWARRQIDVLLAQTPFTEVVLRQLGRQYFRLFESKTLLLSQLPGPACAGYIGAYHDTPPWLAWLVRWWSHAFHALILVGFAFGLCLWRDWRKPWLWLVLAAIGYQLALYLGLHVKARFLLPLLPLFCLFGGEWMAYCCGDSTRLRATPMRLLIAGLLAASLLLLAFAGPWLDGYCAAIPR